MSSDKLKPWICLSESERDKTESSTNSLLREDKIYLL